jgi:hypothetical protein
MVAYSQPGEEWTIYEIDPAVIRVAKDPEHFTFLRDCAKGTLRFEIGDARLRLQQAPDHHYGLLYIDAFSSDVIPMHLLTVEAIKLYRQKLVPDGILGLHLSSRDFELEPLVANLGDALGLQCFAALSGDLSAKALAEGGLVSHWVILVPPSLVPAVLNQPVWLRIPPSAKSPLWTDDFSSLIGVLRFR